MLLYLDLWLNVGVCFRADSPSPTIYQYRTLYSVELQGSKCVTVNYLSTFASLVLRGHNATITCPSPYRTLLRIYLTDSSLMSVFRTGGSSVGLSLTLYIQTSKVWQSIFRKHGVKHKKHYDFWKYNESNIVCLPEQDVACYSDTFCSACTGFESNFTYCSFFFWYFENCNRWWEVCVLKERWLCSGQ